MTALRTLVLFFLVLGLTVGILCMYVYLIYTPAGFQTKVSAQSNVLSPVLQPSPHVRNLQLINYVIDSNLKDTKGTYAIAIIDLESGEKYYFNEHVKFQTASLYKLWVMAEAYSQIENNVIRGDTVIADSVENLNDRFNISSESAERQSGSVSMTIAEAITRMITYSDNYSALLLSTKLKLSNVDKFLKSQNFSDSKIGTTLPVTSAYDIALFYEKLYKNELGDSSTEMLEILKRQQIKRKIPKYIPSDVTIAHKTGELDAFSHDAGIIYTAKGDYVLVILSESNNPPGAEERISKIAEDVYTFMTNTE